MTADEKIQELLKAADGLELGKDSARLAQIYQEAAGLVDKSAKPKKWAAFRYKYAMVMDTVNLAAALAAYREALPHFDPVQDRGMRSAVQASIGYDLLQMGKMMPPESEEAIACFEDAVGEMPWVASELALYYEIRNVGDPLENWQKQTHYLELALAQVTPQGETLQWAQLKNRLAKAQNTEPDGDFLKGTQKRIALHKEALAALDKDKNAAGSPAQNLWIQVCVDLSEACAATGDEKEREQYARAAYAACGPATAYDPRIFATMNLIRLVINSGGRSTREGCLEGLRLSEAAEKEIDAHATPAMAATNLKFRALANLELVKLGETDRLEDLLQAADQGYSLLDANLYADLQRTICQVAVDGLVHGDEFARAIPYLEKATAAGESTLAQATSRAARLERLFFMHDHYALLGYCHFHGSDIRNGIEALDKGKGRWWNAAKASATFEQIQTLVPAGGALLFPAFAPKAGAVAIVTTSNAKICPLPELGGERLHNLLLRDLLNPLNESWIGQYTFRHTHPERWENAIDSVGATLFELLWAPVIVTLDELGVKQNAELVWFPQAGLGVLPLQAAWKQTGDVRHWITESYAIRYAPSASCLLEKREKTKNGTHLVVSNPTGDLPNSALELAWLKQAEPSETLVVLEGAAASKAAVLAKLAVASSLHYSGHAFFSPTDPFQSGLLLARGERLAIEELLPLLRKSQIREVVLSGCETGLAQTHRRPDEFLGLPTAFLENGASAVIATQWPVDDWAAAALVGRFYAEWHKSGAAEAMRRAQNWMRSVTAGELLDLLAVLKELPGEAGDQAAAMRTSLRGVEKKSQPCAHPRLWAAFTVLGG